MAAATPAIFHRTENGGWDDNGFGSSRKFVPGDWYMKFVRTYEIEENVDSSAFNIYLQ